MLTFQHSKLWRQPAQQLVTSGVKNILAVPEAGRTVFEEVNTGSLPHCGGDQLDLPSCRLGCASRFVVKHMQRGPMSGAQRCHLQHTNQARDLVKVKVSIEVCARRVMVMERLQAMANDLVKPAKGLVQHQELQAQVLLSSLVFRRSLPVVLIACDPRRRKHSSNGAYTLDPSRHSRAVHPIPDFDRRIRPQQAENGRQKGQDKKPQLPALHQNATTPSTELTHAPLPLVTGSMQERACSRQRVVVA
jgi:hypothetical protein